MTEVASSVQAERVNEPGSCPECGAADLQRYKVLATGGWREVVKCQSCLTSLERRPWNRLGYVDRDQALALFDGEWSS